MVQSDISHPTLISVPMATAMETLKWLNESNPSGSPLLSPLSQTDGFWYQKIRCFGFYTR